MSEPQPQGHEHDGDQVTAAPHFGESAIHRAAIANPDFVDLSFAAKAATDNERSMTLLQGIKLYPKAVGWSMLLSTCIVMEGYDLVLLGRFVPLPTYSLTHGLCLHALLRQTELTLP
jgi:MFS transporter, SP family, general alpha glucoside:H+ symporter